MVKKNIVEVSEEIVYFVEDTESKFKKEGLNGEGRINWLKNNFSDFLNEHLEEPNQFFKGEEFRDFNESHLFILKQVYLDLLKSLLISNKINLPNGKYIIMDYDGQIQSSPLIVHDHLDFGNNHKVVILESLQDGINRNNRIPEIFFRFIKLIVKFQNEKFYFLNLTLGTYENVSLDLRKQEDLNKIKEFYKEIKNILKTMDDKTSNEFNDMSQKLNDLKRNFEELNENIELDKLRAKKQELIDSIIELLPYSKYFKTIFKLSHKVIKLIPNKINLED